MMDLIRLLIYVVLMYSYAVHEAYRDYTDISLGNEINHGKGFLRRFFIAALFGFIICAPDTVPGPSDVMLLLMAGGMFSVVFRMTLNRKMNLDPFFMGSTSEYDKFWVRASNGNVLRAGRAATITEFGVSAIGAVSYLMTIYG